MIAVLVNNKYHSFQTAEHNVADAKCLSSGMHAENCGTNAYYSREVDKYKNRVGI